MGINTGARFCMALGFLGMGIQHVNAKRIEERIFGAVCLACSMLMVFMEIHS